MYKYELHLHSCQGSKCGVSEGKEYVDFYIKNGYSGAVLTDHFFHGNTRPDRNLPWAQYMDEYLSGYYDMKRAAEGKDFEVFFGRKADKRRKLYNGMIKCQLYMYFK